MILFNLFNAIKMTMFSISLSPKIISGVVIIVIFLAYGIYLVSKNKLLGGVCILVAIGILIWGLCKFGIGRGPGPGPGPTESVQDEPKPDEPKPDEPKPDEPKPDEPKPDEPENIVGSVPTDTIIMEFIRVGTMEGVGKMEDRNPSGYEATIVTRDKGTKTIENMYNEDFNEELVEAFDEFGLGKYKHFVIRNTTAIGEHKNFLEREIKERNPDIEIRFE